MSNSKTKGLNYTVGFMLDGKQQEGSFAKAEGWKATPDDEIKKWDGIGEATSEPDYMHHGWDFNYGIMETDTLVDEFMEAMIAASEAGTKLPRIDLIVITKFVDPTVPTRTVIYGECAVKIDSHDVPDRKGYVKYSISGSCKSRRRL